MKLSLAKNLEPLRANAVAKIDHDAEKVRSLFITTGAGQAMVYQQKLVEAELVMSNPDVDLLKVPHIVHEAQLNGISPQEQASIIIETAAAWRSISPMIEVRRLAAKKAVAVANSPAAIEAATHIDWSDIEALA